MSTWQNVLLSNFVSKRCMSSLQNSCRFTTFAPLIGSFRLMYLDCFFSLCDAFCACYKRQLTSETPRGSLLSLLLSSTSPLFVNGQRSLENVFPYMVSNWVSEHVYLQYNVSGVPSEKEFIVYKSNNYCKQSRYYAK